MARRNAPLIPNELIRALAGLQPAAEWPTQESGPKVIRGTPAHRRWAGKIHKEGPEALNPSDRRTARGEKRMRSIDRYFVGFLAPGAAPAKGRRMTFGRLLAGALSRSALLAAAAPAMAAGSPVEPLRVSAAATDKVPAKVASG